MLVAVVIIGLLADAGEYRFQAELTVLQRDEGFQVETQERHAMLVGGNVAAWSSYEYPQSSHERVSVRSVSVNGVDVTQDVVTRFAPDDLDVFLSDVIVHRVLLTTLSAGDKVEIVVSRWISDLGYLPALSVPNLRSLRSYEVLVKHPEACHVTFEVATLDPAVRHEVLRPDPEQTQFSLQDVDYRDVRTFFPFPESVMTVIPKLKWNGSAMTHDDPVSFNRWYRNLLAELPELDEAGRAFVTERVAETLDPKQQVSRLFEFVRDQIRYDADMSDNHAIVPHDPNQVLMQRYGDCKDKSFLLSAMAAALGLDVRVALVSTREQPPTETIRVQFFDHVLNYWESPDGPLFFDATFTRAPMGAFAEPLAFRQALVLDLSGQDLPLRRTMVPQDVPSVALEIAGAIAQSDAAKATAQFGSGFSYAIDQTESDRLAFENNISNMVTSLLFKLSCDYFTKQESGSYECVADLGQFVVTTKRKAYLPSVPFVVPLDGVWQRADDSLPIYLPSRLHLRLKLHLEHPGFVAQPQAVAFSGGAGATFSAKLEQVDPQNSLITYEFELNQTCWPADQKAALIEFARNYFKRRSTMLMLTRGE